MKKKLQLFLFAVLFLTANFAIAQTWEEVKRIGGSGFEDSDGIVRDNDGNFYITGQFNNDITFGSITLNSSTDNIFVAKLDSNGNGIWAKSFLILNSFFNDNICASLAGDWLQSRS